MRRSLIIHSEAYIADTKEEHSINTIPDSIVISVLPDRDTVIDSNDITDMKIYIHWLENRHEYKSIRK